MATKKSSIRPKKLSTVEFFRGYNNRWYWRLRHPNGNISAVSSESDGYGSFSAVMRAWRRVFSVINDKAFKLVACSGTDRSNRDNT